MLCVGLGGWLGLVRVGWFVGWAWSGGEYRGVRSFSIRYKL